MTTTKFRVLMIGGHFVDVNRMHGEGGYFASTPNLYDATYTKEDILNTAKKLGPKYLGYTEGNIANIERNLRDCRMVDVELVLSEIK